MPIGPPHRGPGKIKYPICCGGEMMTSGDTITEDLNGIVEVTQAGIRELHQRPRKHKERMASYFENVRRGKSSNAWVDDSLGRS